MIGRACVLLVSSYWGSIPHSLARRHWQPMCKMAAFISGIFWVHFWKVGWGGDALSIYTYNLWCAHVVHPQKYITAQLAACFCTFYFHTNTDSTSHSRPTIRVLSVDYSLRQISESEPDLGKKHGASQTVTCPGARVALMISSTAFTWGCALHSATPISALSLWRTSGTVSEFEAQL